MWKGMTMYSLTLEERATCPTDCEQWDNCYGDNMPFAHRFDHTHVDFKDYLEVQLRALNDKHKEGFVVRLHVLGDFYNEIYITQWQLWLDQYPNMHAFGYTHHASKSPLGNMLNNLNRIYPTRFRIRFSDDPSTTFSAHVTNKRSGKHYHWTAPNVRLGGAIFCPEQQGKTDSCASCGYCWSSDEPVIFVEH